MTGSDAIIVRSRFLIALCYLMVTPVFYGWGEKSGTILIEFQEGWEEVRSWLFWEAYV